MNETDVIFNQTIGSWLTNNASWLVLVMLWSVIWKGLALWRAARAGDKAWFGVILFINTLGILEILYVFYFSKLRAVTEAKIVKEK